MSIEDMEHAARARILELLGTESGADGPTLFASHHKDASDTSYWQGHLGTPDPSPRAILHALVLIDSWSSRDDGPVDTLDFTLPGEVTDQLPSVRFEGEVVAEGCMES